MAETVLSVDAVVATPVATKRWSLESDENEFRVNSTDAPAALFADVWTPWTERGAEACYVELRRRVAATASGRAPAAGDAFAASDGDRTLACVLECGGDYAGAPWRARLGRSSTGEDAYLTLGELLEAFHGVRRAKHEVHLADAPGTLRSVVADNVEFEVLTEQSPASRAAAWQRQRADALLARPRGRLQVPPPLRDRADSTVACLESIDAALFGDDDDSARRRRQRGAPNEVAVYAVGEPRASQEAGGDEPTRPSVRHLRSLPAKRSARAKLRALVGALEALAEELEKRQIDSVASDDLMPALCEAVPRASRRPRPGRGPPSSRRNFGGVGGCDLYREERADVADAARRGSVAEDRGELGAVESIAALASEPRSKRSLAPDLYVCVLGKKVVGPISSVTACSATKAA
ncbi:vacuolar sorting protein 9 (VPS9) domain containing protein [Aureococcus anophagefferens]|nr:vacuolar sorting protein 9 (VPS9) domain containing protein [Aureococcus anophagefferens]